MDGREAVTEWVRGVSGIDASLQVHYVQTSLSAIHGTSSGCHATEISQGVVNA